MTGTARATLLTITCLFACLPTLHPSSVALADGPTATSPSESQATPGRAASQPHRLRDDPRYRRLGLTTIWSVVLIIVFLAGSFAIIKFSRRMTQFITTEKSAPTQVDDIWAMHKAPENPESYLKEEDYDGFNTFDGPTEFTDGADRESDVDEADDDTDTGFDPDNPDDNDEDIGPNDDDANGPPRGDGPRF